MKKRFAALLALMLLCTGCAYANDLGIQVIGEPDAASAPVSLDDIQLGTTYTIDGYARIIPQSFAFVDFFAQFDEDADYSATSVNTSNKKFSTSVYYTHGGFTYNLYNQARWMDSGSKAEFVWLQLDIINLQKKDVMLMEEASIKVIYADEYEFAGWMRQIEYDYSHQVHRYEASTTGAPFAVLAPKNEEAIGMLYTGVFVVGATLPNAVVEDKTSPLSIVLTLGGNEITYNVRK